MSNPEKLTFHGRKLLDRRNFLHTAGLSTAGIALTSMLAADGLPADDKPLTAGGKAPIRPKIDPNNPYAARGAHFEMPAKQVQRWLIGSWRFITISVKKHCDCRKK